MKQILVVIIRLYQKTVSPDHGLLKSRYPYGFCRFYPSCSEYAAQAITTHGAVKGVYYGVRRIIRCNPFSRPGVDHIPKL